MRTFLRENWIEVEQVIGGALLYAAAGMMGWLALPLPDSGLYLLGLTLLIAAYLLPAIGSVQEVRRVAVGLARLRDEAPTDEVLHQRRRRARRRQGLAATMQPYLVVLHGLMGVFTMMAAWRRGPLELTGALALCAVGTFVWWSATWTQHYRAAITLMVLDEYQAPAPPALEPAPPLRLVVGKKN